MCVFAVTDDMILYDAYMAKNNDNVKHTHTRKSADKRPSPAGRGEREKKRDDNIFHSPKTTKTPVNDADRSRGPRLISSSRSSLR